MAIPVLAGVVMKIAAPLIVQKLAGKVSKKEADDISAQVVQEIVTQVTADPVLKNEMNAEEPWQSRVAAGASAVLAGQAMVQIEPVGEAFDILAPIAVWAINLFGADLQPPPPGYVGRVLGACVTLWGAGYVFYGRFTSGLRPLFSRK